jgi:hypothetical protein
MIHDMQLRNFAPLGSISEMESVSINKTSARWSALLGATWSARTPISLGTLREARSQIEPGIWRAKGWKGRAGQAFALVEFGVVDRATANYSPRTAAGYKQVDQTAKSKPPAGSCSRILDQSPGSTRARSSRNRPLEWTSTMAGLLRGWAGRSQPVTPKPTEFASNTRSERWRTSLWSLVGRIGIFVFHAITASLNIDPLPVMHEPVDQGRGQGVVHVEEFAPLSEGSIRGDHDRSRFITGGDNLEQQIGTTLVDGQIAQLIEEEKETDATTRPDRTRIRPRLSL